MFTEELSSIDWLTGVDVLSRPAHVLLMSRLNLAFSGRENHYLNIIQGGSNIRFSHHGQNN